MRDRCIRCDRELTLDEIALYKTLVNRGAEECCCISCLSRHFCVDEGMLYEKIEQFRRQGCVLFS